MFWGPSRGNPTRWCPTLAMNVAPVFRRISVFQEGVILLLETWIFAISAELGAVGFDCPKQAGFPSRGNAT